MLTQKDVAMMVLDAIRESGYYNMDGEEAAAELNRICGMVALADRVIEKIEEEGKNG